MVEQTPSAVADRSAAVSQFANLVERHVDALLQRWVSGVQHGHDLKSSSPARLREQLPSLLRSLIEALRRGSTLGAEAPAGAADAPRRFGFDVQGLVREYGLLGGVLLDLAEESGAAMSPAEVRVFTDFMAAAVADGVAAHAHFRADTDRTDEAAANQAQGDQRRAEAGRDRLHAQSQAERDASELERLQDLLREAPVPICIFEGPLLTFTFANSAYRATVGGRELVGKPLLDALPEVRGQGFDALLAGVMSSGEPYFGNEMPVRIANLSESETRYFSFVYQPRRNSAGAVNSVLVVGTDVTAQVQARKRVEAESEAVGRSEERLRRLIEATGAGTWDLDLVTQLVTADPPLRALHGFPPDGPFSLEAAVATIDPADQPRIRAAIEAALDPKGSRRYLTEYCVTDSSGHPRWIEARGRAYFDATGRPSELLGTAVDITARKEAELAREGLLAALEAQPFLQVCVLEGPRQVVKLVNAEYRANVAGGRDIVGKPVLDMFPELAGQGFDLLMKQVLETGEPYIGREVSTRLDTGTGVLEERFFNFVVQPVRGPHGTVDTLLNISHDVTHFVRARRALEGIAAQEKERAGFERQLIGIVSHDLRNPLSTIRMGAALLLRQEDLAPTSRKTVLRIQATLERMVRLVNDLLDFTQVRLGSGLPIVRAPMNLHSVVYQAAEELQMTFPDREIKIEAEGDGQGLWDRERLGQVALNLITNALKYSPPDAAVRVSTRADGDRVELQIFNPGEPIAPDALPRIFQPMQRGSSDADPSGRSVGLGLYIVKHIVDALDGTIAFTSSAGAGTTFTLSLPRGPRPPA